MKDINIKGIIIALVIGIVLSVIVGIGSIFFFAESMSPGAIDALWFQTDFLIFISVVSSFTCVLTGYISAKYGKEAPYKNALVLSLIGMAFSLMFPIYEPVWFDVIGLITLIPLTLFGSYVWVRHTAQ
ncbi:hypothetical protein MHO82_12780 [Vibrio sp. Of7-15]|uniref:hypothetical protein n=1 Tax=Vibrio sp. Of7-15 TaxID=2724879 RepID=UPI001EF330E3|nr:hypothetical protein [Vibrio sp. Of7-15]MCG7497738.1 hypothetical protein [Vibrio sp. Of7-15]